MQGWENFLSQQEEELGAKTVDLWLRSLRILRYDACNIYLEAKDAFQAIWFEEHIRNKALEYLVNNNNKRIKVHLSVANAQNLPQKKGKKGKEALQSKPSFSIKFEELNPLNSFDYAISSAGNLLVHKLLCKITNYDPISRKIINSAEAFASFNPIYIFGAEGTGKTHLLTATALALKAQDLNVVYARAETFTDHVVTAIRAAEMGIFRQAYRNIDALLIDDVHLFSGKGATQEELFHTFNSLHLAGKQIIFSANCSPAELQNIEPRLVSRFEWGIVLPIEPLEETELKQALERKAEAFEFPLPEKVASFLAETFSKNTKSTMRALEALILRFHIQQEKEKHAVILSVHLARTLLADLIKEEELRKLTSDQIIQSVSDHFNITPEEILGKAQTRDCVLPRHLAIYLCRTKLKLPYTKIGELFTRDHSTVMTSVKLIQQKVNSYDQELTDHYRSIVKKLS